MKVCCQWEKNILGIEEMDKDYVFSVNRIIDGNIEGEKSHKGRYEEWKVVKLLEKFSLWKGFQ